MNEYVISREELRKWCSVPVDELGTHPDRKMELMMGEIRPLFWKKSEI